MSLRAPFPWFGGKSRVAHLVWERFGDVPNYVEPFAGSLAVLLGRPTDPRVETVNDLDAHLANFWRAVAADPEGVAAAADWPVSEPDLHARHLWLVTHGRERVARLTSDPDYYDVRSAGWWVWGICQWIGSGWCREIDARRPDLHSAGHGVHAVPRKVPMIGREGRGVHYKRPAMVRGERGIWTRHRIGGSGVGVHSNGRRDQPPETCDERRAAVVDLMGRLRDRLRRVRVCCGDWTRVLGPTPTYHIGLTGVFLDPPYSQDERGGHDSKNLYAADEEGVADAVRDWAIANGDHPKMRIALCGYEGEHAMPATWSQVRWKAPGGYASRANGKGKANAHREAIWFSPHCLSPDAHQHELFAHEAAG